MNIKQKKNVFKNVCNLQTIENVGAAKSDLK